MPKKATKHPAAGVPPRIVADATDGAAPELPELPPELVDRVLLCLPTSELVRVTARLSRSHLARLPFLLRARLRAHFAEGAHPLRATFACGWPEPDSDDSDYLSDESEQSNGKSKGAFVLNAVEMGLSANPWLGEWSGPGEQTTPDSILLRGWRASKGDGYRGLPIILREPDSVPPPKKPPTFRQLVKGFFNSKRVSFAPSESFRVFASRPRHAPSSVFFALVDSDDLPPTEPGGKPRRLLTGNPGWWDEFQVVEPDPSSAPPGRSLDLLDVDKDKVHVGRGHMLPLAAALDSLWLADTDRGRHLTPTGSFAVPLPVPDFCTSERRRFRGIADGLTTRGWAGEVEVGGRIYWMVEIREVQVGMMCAARKVDLEERAPHGIQH
ncbi:hypothetical protein DFJ74DRAFT_756974 [Hyaloraphidium curvatum]|nr:hypothetical protein DFJ74DRAFT_756974 [Hyaloraphidium curvatum]